MERLSKTNEFRWLIHFLFFSSLLLTPSPSPAKSPDPWVNPLEKEISIALSKQIQCKKIEVQIDADREKSNKIKNLAIKLDGVVLDPMVADYLTLTYEYPVVDLTQLKRANEWKMLSYGKNKVSLLISAGAIEQYLSNKANQLKRRYDRMSIKFAPPYIECLFDVPASEISPETLKLLKQFVKNAKIEGYAAFQIKAKDNALYASSSKVIVNHFLIPQMILKELETKFNPFDGVPVLRPFQYSINTVTVQNKYMYLTN